jgi:GNAT superfamily N-acetyltransferase
MEMIHHKVNIIDVTPDNVADVGVFCIKDKKSTGYQAKVEWFKLKLNKGLRIKIAADSNGKQLGFIEYIPSELAWRPIKADNFFFIQCIGLFVSELKGKGIGSFLIQECEKDAKESMKSGVCAMSSKGPWIANKSLFEKNLYVVADSRDRFELMVKSFDDKKTKPCFNDWTKVQYKYKGWNIVYSDQCPWHQKAIADLQQSAVENKIELIVINLNTPQDAQNAPSGFGTFSLLKDGKLLADHYISRTRFENILRNEDQKRK